MNRHTRPDKLSFGTPEKDQALKIYDGSHTVWFGNDVIPYELEFLDKHLGPVRC